MQGAKGMGGLTPVHSPALGAPKKTPERTGW